MDNRVVITGVGPVTSAGIGKEAFFQGLMSGMSVAREVPDEFTRAFPLKCRWYVPLPDVSASEEFAGCPHDNLMQPEDNMAVLAAQLALRDAGLLTGSKPARIVEDSAECGFTLGTGLTGMQTAFESYLSHTLGREALQAALPGRQVTFNRMVVPKTMPDSPAAWASILFGLLGPCFTINASCASGTYAIGEAFRRIRHGYSQTMLAGGVECLVEPAGFMMRGFDMLGVLTRSANGQPGPFGRQRTGFLFAEGGACVLVLEELEHARRRGARIYAEIADFRSNSDAFSILQMDPKATQIARLLRELSSGRTIDYLNTHGTGTVANDDIEAKVISEVFGERQVQPLVNSTKGIVGHALGASGAIEAAVTALSVDRGVVHPNLVSEPFDHLNLPLTRTERVIGEAISVSYGFGGHNAGLRMVRFQGG